MLDRFDRPRSRLPQSPRTVDAQFLGQSHSLQGVIPRPYTLVCYAEEITCGRDILSSMYVRPLRDQLPYKKNTRLKFIQRICIVKLNQVHLFFRIVFYRNVS